MSASVYWQPVKGQPIPYVGASSGFIEALTRAGLWGRILTAEDTAVLRGLAAGLESQDQREAAEALEAAVLDHGNIRVWAEY